MACQTWHRHRWAADGTGVIAICDCPQPRLCWGVAVRIQNRDQTGVAVFVLHNLSEGHGPFRPCLPAKVERRLSSSAPIGVRTYCLHHLLTFTFAVQDFTFKRARFALVAVMVRLVCDCAVLFGMGMPIVLYRGLFCQQDLRTKTTTISVLAFAGGSLLRRSRAHAMAPQIYRFSLCSWHGAGMPVVAER